MTISELVNELNELRHKHSPDTEVVICLDGDAMDISSVDFMDEEGWVTINS